MAIHGEIVRKTPRLRVEIVVGPLSFFDVLDVAAWLGRVCLIAAFLHGCAPLPGPTVPDSATDGGCALDDRISAARIIANPDGTPLVIHCDGGSQ